MTARILTVFAILSPVFGGCSRKSEQPSPPAAGSATPAQTATAPAPDLPPLPTPRGLDAPGAVPGDLAAARAVAACPFTEDTVSCPAVDKFASVIQDFVTAPEPAHVATLVDLLGAREPQIRWVVLERAGINYLKVYAKGLPREIVAPIVQAALAETDHRVRAAFASQLSSPDIDWDKLRLRPYLAAVAERYSRIDGGTDLLKTVAGGDDQAQAGSQLLAIASHNPDLDMKARALSAAAELDKYTLPPAACPLLAAARATSEEERARQMMKLLVDRGCEAELAAYLSDLSKSCRAGECSVPSSDILQDLATGPHAAGLRPTLVRVRDELAKVPENARSSGASDMLASIEEALNVTAKP